MYGRGSIEESATCEFELVLTAIFRSARLRDPAVVITSMIGAAFFDRP
jgi:hypothetical protein